MMYGFSYQPKYKHTTLHGLILHIVNELAKSKQCGKRYLLFTTAEKDIKELLNASESFLFKRTFAPSESPVIIK